MPRYPKHDHKYAPVVATKTEPGSKPAKWKQCRICGADDPAKPKPEEAA